MDRIYRVNAAAGKRLAPGEDTPDRVMAAGGAVSCGNYRGRLKETDSLSGIIVQTHI